jgi:glycerate-2-kinase
MPEAALISNKAELINNGTDGATRRARRLVLETLEFTLASVDPHTLVSQKVKRRGDRLRVENQDVPLSAYDRIFVVGAGKASGAMAEALEAILGNRLSGGLVVVPSGQQPPKLERVRFVTAPHPTPDTNSVNAAKALITLVEGLNSRDLLICLISGGGSALLSLPTEPLTIDDKGTVARLIMNAGANIVELNTVRKHLSKIKGGWLAKRSHAGRILGLIISDVVGDRLDSIASGPISPDATTFSDAIAVLKRYNLWEIIPSSATKILDEGANGSIPESPKSGDPCFHRVSYHFMGNSRVACTSARRYLQSKGVKAEILTSSAAGEARYLGSFIGSMARDIVQFDEPFRRPCAFIVGGETTVTVTGSGRGGRNQECTMACAEKIQGLKGIAMASIGSDGIDGPTDAAGAIADGMTISRSEELALKFDELLAQNDSYRFFLPLKDLIMTGRTNTNVNDVSVVVLI